MQFPAGDARPPPRGPCPGGVSWTGCGPAAGRRSVVAQANLHGWPQAIASLADHLRRGERGWCGKKRTNPAPGGPGRGVDRAGSGCRGGAGQLDYGGVCRRPEPSRADRSNGVSIGAGPTVARPPASKWRVASQAWRPVAWAERPMPQLGGDRGKTRSVLCVGCRCYRSPPAGPPGLPPWLGGNSEPSGLPVVLIALHGGSAKRNRYPRRRAPDFVVLDVPIR